MQQHSVVLVRGGRSQDCPGVRYHLIRGALDLVSDDCRLRSRNRSEQESGGSGRTNANDAYRVVSVTESLRDPSTEPRSQRRSRSKVVASEDRQCNGSKHPVWDSVQYKNHPSLVPKETWGSILTK